MSAGGEDPRNHFLGKEVLPSSSQHLCAEVRGTLVYLSVFSSHEALSMDHMLPAGRMQLLHGHHQEAHVGGLPSEGQVLMTELVGGD